jgi:hypothetical protein
MCGPVAGAFGAAFHARKTPHRGVATVAIVLFDWLWWPSRSIRRSDLVATLLRRVTDVSVARSP